jgi:flagellar biogenesis protein FliO
MQLIRCGQKLLLLSVTPSGAETLTEIKEPDEVARLVGLCRQSQPGSASQAFRHVFQQFAGPGKLEGPDV